MARIRTIKPDFWSSEQISELSIPARLLFIGMWNFCDDNGILPASHKSLRMKLFPGDERVENQDVAYWINELISKDLLHEYEAEGKLFWWVIEFKKHQKIDKPVYKFPLPSKLELNKNCQKSPTTPRGIGEQSPAEWKGMEGNVMDSNGKEKNILLLRSM